MNTRQIALLGLVALCAACSREVASPPVAPTSTETTGPGATGVATTVPGAPDTTPTTPAPSVTAAVSTLPATTAATVPVVTSDIVGVAAAGNSGGVGVDQTDSFSEAIRNADGTCSGWAGRDVPPPWTDGLVSGAPFRILSRDGEVLGEGTLGTSSFENVGTSTEQWVCSFPFSATIVGNPEEFMIEVAGLEPWLARRDPTRPDQFVASVNTVADFEFFAECTDPTTFAVTEWSAVGRYWSDGFSTLCANGLKIADVERPCRGPDEGSDYVTLVTSAADPSIVYEDAGGLEVDVATLLPGEPVIVHVATGRPCG